MDTYFTTTCPKCISNTTNMKYYQINSRIYKYIPTYLVVEAKSYLRTNNYINFRTTRECIYHTCKNCSYQFITDPADREVT